MYAVVAAHCLVWFGSVSRTMACLYLLPQKDVVWLFWTAPLQYQVSDCPPLKIPKYVHCSSIGGRPVLRDFRGGGGGGARL